MMRRVVVTGLGLVTPLGCGTNINWTRLIKGDCAIERITHFETDDLNAQIAGCVPKGDYADGKFNPDEWVSPKDQRKMDDFISYAIAAATQAVDDAGWKPENEEDREATGVMIGSGIGGLTVLTEGGLILNEKGPRKMPPYFIPASLINLASGHVSIKYGFKGPNHAVVTACSTGAHAIGDAARLIMFGDADVMVAGGTEAAVCRVGIAGFCAARALSTGYNNDPQHASRPWDKARDGFVMGDGAGVLVLEEYEHAKKRGAKIYAEVAGYGLSGDAYHITAPSPTGDGAFRAMRNALKRAEITADDLGYINAHGTSTPLGDEIEHLAVKRLLGNAVSKVSMSSTKSAIGHLLGAAGGVEAIYSIMALNHNIMPPTLNLDNPSDGCDMDLIPHTAKERKLNYVMSNSFGFGGTNASLVFGKIQSTEQKYNLTRLRN